MGFKILLIKDQRPGHFRKSEGIAAAVARRVPGTEVERLDVRMPRFIRGSLQRMLLSAPVPDALLVRLVTAAELGRIARPDLIVSAGADTLVLNVRLARHFGARNVFSGSVRDVPPERLTAIIHTDPARAALPHHIISLAPSGVDPDRLPPPRPLAAGMDAGTAALLIGGPAPGYAFGEADWAGLERLVEESAARGLRWIATSSRRTPDAVADRLLTFAKAQGEAFRFIDYRSARTGSIEPLFAADAIFVTEDSNTMIAEAVATRRPVVALRPGTHGGEAPALRHLLKERHVAVLPMAEISLKKVEEALAAMRPLAANPLDLLGERLAAAGAIPG